MKKFLTFLFLLVLGFGWSQSPAQLHQKQYAYGYDAAYTGDWRFVPGNITCSETYAIDSITNKSFFDFEILSSDDLPSYIKFKIPAWSPVVMVTFTIDDSDGFGHSFLQSTNSTNGTDGTWSNIPFFLQNWEYHSSTAQNLTFETSGTDRWVYLYFTNSATGTLQIRDVGFFKLNTKPWLRNDIWLAFGASLVSSAFNTTEANLYAREQFGTDPLIINLAYPGKTTQYLVDSIQQYLDANKYAGYAFIHMGGNNVSNTRPWSSTTAGERESLIDGTINVIGQLEREGILPIYGRLSFRRYPDAPSVQDGVYEENGSLPYNIHGIDSVIKIHNPRAFDFENNIPMLDYYGHTMLDSTGLNVDGIHLNTDGKRHWMEYSVRVVGEYVYNHTKADTLYYRTWIENCIYFIAIAETSGTNADIVTAQFYVDKLPAGAEKTTFQNRIDAITCIDCDITQVYVNLGSNTLTNWNTFSVRTAGASLTNLIDDGGGATTIGITTTSGWTTDAGYSSSGMNTGSNAGYFPDLALSQGWYARGVLKDLTFTGLDVGKTYTIELLPSANSVGKRLTSYTIGGTSIGVDGELNINNVARFQNIVPNGSGQIIIQIRNGELIDPVNESSGYGYVNAVKIYWSN